MPDSLRQFKTEIFQTLANPTRIAALDELRDGELTVGDIVSRLGGSNPTCRSIWPSCVRGKS